MASTVQHGATARHAATHNTVAYTVAATHCTTWATVLHMATQHCGIHSGSNCRQHRTLAYKMASTVQHEATSLHAATSGQILNWLSIIKVDRTKIRTKNIFTRNFIIQFTVIMATKGLIQVELQARKQNSKCLRLHLISGRAYTNGIIKPCYGFAALWIVLIKPSCQLSGVQCVSNMKADLKA